MSDMNDQERTIRLLNRMRDGDRDASEELLAIVHGELREIARRVMGNGHGPQTMQATALVNEAWMRLAQIEPVQRSWLRVRGGQKPCRPTAESCKEAKWLQMNAVCLRPLLPPTHSFCLPRFLLTLSCRGWRMWGPRQR